MKKKKKGATRFGLLIVFFLISITLLGQLINLGRNFFKPPIETTKKYTWDGKTNINLVIRGEEVSFISFDPNAKKLNIISVPSETYLEIPGGFGSWVLSSIYDLGQSEKQPKGGLFLEKSLSYLFGLPVDGYINLNKHSPSDFIYDLHKNPVKTLLVRDIETNLSPFELIRLNFAISKVRSDKISKFDLQKQNVLIKTNLPDGTVIFKPDLGRVDSFVSQNLYESKLKEEQISIAVFNATNTPGLAQKFSRLISNMGGHVIISSNTTPTQTSISTSASKNSYTVKRLQQILGFVTLDENLTNSRADVNVVLGESSF